MLYHEETQISFPHFLYFLKSLNRKQYRQFDTLDTFQWLLKWTYKMHINVQFPAHISYNGKYKRRNMLYCSHWCHNSHYRKYNSFTGLLNLWTLGIVPCRPHRTSWHDLLCRQVVSSNLCSPLSKITLPRKLQITLLYTVLCTRRK